MNNNETSPKIIGEFYRNSSIFITGSTGFLGKVLVEKLLRSCDGIKTIYLLLRPKRNLTSEQRFVDYVKNNIFDRIRADKPEVLDKLVCVNGDVAQPHLGLSEKDIHELVHNVNIVFHVAATVRFNESLRDAANLNTLGKLR
jgi:fatty acyl-CoA reductase